MTHCLHCDSVLSQGRNSTGKYCNNKCQGNHTIQKSFQKVEEGTANPRSVKMYLIEKHGNRCMSPNCAWDFTKSQVNVELEHIDGDSTNNTLSNCILLCPNCHSQTSTYKAKNIGNGRHSRRQRYASGKSY